MFKQSEVAASYLTDVGNTKVRLVSAFGNEINALLANIPCKVQKTDDTQSPTLTLTCAVTDKLQSHCLLTPQDYIDLISNTHSDNAIQILLN